MEKECICATIAFENTSEIENIETEIAIRHEIADLLMKYCRAQKISCFAVDNVDIESLKK